MAKDKVILNSTSKKSLDEKETAILAHAYQQKSLCSAQLAESSNDRDKKMYYQDALKEIKKACDLATKSNKRQEYLKTLLHNINQNLLNNNVITQKDIDLATELQRFC